MADPVLNALNRKLKAYESAGMTEHAKQVKARIAKLEKPAKPAASESAAPKPTVKKTVKKLSAPKKAPQKRKK